MKPTNERSEETSGAGVKPSTVTLEQIQAVLSDLNRTLTIAPDKPEVPLAVNIIIHALTLAEQVAKGDVFLVTPEEKSTIDKVNSGEVVLEQPWQPIETAPKDGTEFNISDKKFVSCGYYGITTYDKTKTLKTFGGVLSGPIPYWKPLPQPPQEVVTQLTTGGSTQENAPKEASDERD